jgi:hypothetical protein
MKIVTASNGKKTLKISKKEWLSIGLKFAGKESLINMLKNKNISPEQIRGFLEQMGIPENGIKQILIRLGFV